MAAPSKQLLPPGSNKAAYLACADERHRTAMPEPRDEDLSKGQYWLAMAGIVGLAGVIRVAILTEFVLVNPIAEVPWMDSLEYWNIAAGCASGDWAQPTPFLSAPLYPYFLGILRIVGLDLIGVAVVQLIMHLLTAVVTGEAARAASTRSSGLMASVAFLLLTEPAVVFTRLFSENLQVLLVALLLWQWTRTARQLPASWAGIAACSVLLGLLAVTYPPAILLIPVWAVWLAVANGPTRRAAGQAVLGIGIAALTISPATLHNWVLHGEPIPITAHSGITLRQGNGPEATGIIHSIPGVVARRDRMHMAAAAVFRDIHGREGTWREIDSHFRDEVLRHWAAHPFATLRLACRKAWLFLTARHYGDMLAITVEREIGLSRISLLAPVAVPWIMGAAGIGLFRVLRHPMRFAPLWILTLLPLLIVMAFFYSPRYRFPAIPALCGLTAVAVSHLAACPPAGRWRLLAVCGLPVLGGVFNEATGIDSPQNQRGHVLRAFSEAQAAAAARRIDVGRHATAERRLHSAIQLCDTNIEAYEMLVRLYRLTNSPERAVAPLRRLTQLSATDIGLRKTLYHVLCEVGELTEAATVLGEISSLETENIDSQLALAWMEATASDERVRDGEAALGRMQRIEKMFGAPTPEMLAVRAAAEAECGKFEQAVETATRAAADARHQRQQILADSLERAATEFAERRSLRAPPRPLE